MKWLAISVMMFLLSIGASRAEEILAESSFDDGSKPDGWTVSGSSVVLSNTLAGKYANSLTARSHGHLGWHFVAPKKFLGNKVETYNGWIELSISHVSHAGSLDASHADGLLIESKAYKLTLGTSVSVGQNRIRLAEQFWTIQKGKGSGHSPTQAQLLRALSKISSILVDGNFYSREEVTSLDYFRMIQGRHDSVKLKKQVEELQGAVTETGGVGVVLKYAKTNSKDEESRRVLVVKEIRPGSPADASGMIVEGDFILKVNGREIRDLSLREVAQLMIGPVGTQVKLSMLNAHGHKFEEVLVRSKMPGGNVPAFEVEKLRRKSEL